jgi:uncharacterized damage-inducible protein DinB
MSIVKLILKEFELEIIPTRKMLAIVPDDKYDWKPHEKSMSLKGLASHVAEITGWLAFVIETDKLDFAAGYTPPIVGNNQELMKLMEDSCANSLAVLNSTTDDIVLNQRWVMCAGEQVFMDLSKYEAIRHSMAQLIHHRAQLGVFLRLLNIPIPGTYGPSADDKMGM